MNKYLVVYIKKIPDSSPTNHLFNSQSAINYRTPCLHLKYKWTARLLTNSINSHLAAGRELTWRRHVASWATRAAAGGAGWTGSGPRGHGCSTSSRNVGVPSRRCKVAAGGLTGCSVPVCAVSTSQRSPSIIMYISLSRRERLCRQAPRFCAVPRNLGSYFL